MKRADAAALRDQYSHFEKSSRFSPYLPAHFAHQKNHSEIHVPVDYINWHEAIEILAVLEGDLHILCGEDIRHVHAGEIVAVDSFALHGTFSPSENAEVFYIKIEPELYRECEIPFEGISHTALIRDEEINTIIWHLVDLNKDRNAPYFIPRFKAYLILLITMITERYSFPRQKETAPKRRHLSHLIPAIEYIHTHFTEKPSVAEIATVAHISESHLLHIFREATGMSVLQYVNHLCFLYAKALFSTTDMSVGEVATACGFGSLSYFCQEYTRRTGESPSAAKKSRDREHQSP